VGIRLDHAGGLGTEWVYQDIEANSVFGLFTDSDFGGGGTDVRGHILRLGYKLSDKVNVRGALFLNDRGYDYGADIDYKRLQVEVNMAY
jgi:hypothetical protein